MRHDLLLCLTAHRPRAALDEHDDRALNLFRRGEISLVNTQPRRAIAHHDVPISRELDLGDAFQPERPQASEELISIARVGGCIELERELADIARAEKRLQRAKHFTGPATKAC